MTRNNENKQRSKRINSRKSTLICGGILLCLFAFSIGKLTAQRSSPPMCSPEINIAETFKNDPDAVRVSRTIDRKFSDSLQELKSNPPQDEYHRINLLGRLLLHDKNLSVNRNIACVSCHTADTGFTNGVSLWNRTIVAHPGSVFITNSPGGGSPNMRIAVRKPQSYSYAAFSPILHFNHTQKDFQGGNFWDMRATGLHLGNPAAAQAQGPPLEADEMGFADKACVVHRISQSPYRGLFEQVWGRQSFALKWPSNIDRICAVPSKGDENKDIVPLSPVDRGTVNDTYSHMAIAIAVNEAGPEVSPFSSKFDYALAHPDEQVLTADELAGWQLFRTKGKCNQCHLDGTSPLSGSITPAKAADKAPLFTDFTSANLGIPRNPALPYYCEDRPDQYGFVPNPKGKTYVDHGVADFLRSEGLQNKDWRRYADRFDGKFQVSTLRNVDLRPRPDFVKAYGHNGYFKSLKAIVHFYNTRDILPKCAPGAAGAGKTCWPAPEVDKNVNRKIGHLGMSDHEENLIVIFLGTLSDGYVPPKPK